MVGVDQSVVSRIVQNTDFGKIHNEYQEGKSVEEIADTVGLSRNRISEIVGNTDFGKIDNEYQEGKSVEEIADTVGLVSRMLLNEKEREGLILQVLCDLLYSRNYPWASLGVL